MTRGAAKTNVSIRLSDRSRHQWAELARAEKTSMAEILTVLIDRAHVARFGEAAPQDGAELAAMWKGKAK